MQTQKGKRRMCIVSSPITKPENTITKTEPVIIKTVPHVAKKTSLIDDLKVFFADVSRRSILAYKKSANFFTVNFSAIPTKKITKKLAMPSALLVSAIIMTAFTNLGFDAYLNGKYIGTVKGYEETITLLDHVNTEYAPADGSSLIEKAPELFLRLVTNKGYSSTSSVVNNILVASGQMCEAFVFYANDQRICALKSANEINNALNIYKDSFGYDSSINVKHSIVSELVYTNELSDVDGAVETLKAKNIPVLTNEYVTVTESIPYAVETITDASKRVGSVAVSKEGKDGEKNVKLLVTKENGNVISQKVVEETIISEPSSKIEKVGSKPLPTGIGTGKFIKPAVGSITSYFGKRWGRNHNGIDYAGKKGDAICAADDGTVIFSGTQDGFGQIIILDHKNGYKTYYGHCSALYFNEGDRVYKGEIIAAIGNTGNSTGPHLHFEIRKDDAPLNPVSFVK